MKLVYQGAQIGDVNCVRFTWSREGLYGADRMLYGWMNRADFGEITFAVNGQADCATKMALIETLLSMPYGDLKILNDDGSASVNSVLNSATVDGVRPLSWTWGDQPGAQFTTWRSLSASFEWETRTPSLSSGYLTDFTEQITVAGGVPRVIVQPPINTPVSAADEFTTVPKQAYTILQRGRAIGLSAYPTAPTPVIANPSDYSVTHTSPRKVGSNYEDWVTEWAYGWQLGALVSLPVPTLWT